MGRKIRVLVLVGLACGWLGPVGEPVLAAGGRFPLIERAIANIQARVRQRAGSSEADGQPAPQGDPYANPIPPLQRTDQSAVRPKLDPEQLQQLLSRPFFNRLRNQQPTSGSQSQTVGRIPTLAPWRGAFGPRTPTLAPPQPAARQEAHSPVEPPSAVSQATSILVTPDAAAKTPANRPAVEAPSAAAAASQEHSGPREF